MGLQLVTQSRKFFSQLKNGESYSLNLSDFATHLKGSVMERLKAVYTVDIQWSSISTSTSPFSYSGNTITRSSGSFIADGFSVGDTIDIAEPSPAIAASGRIILVLDDTTMIFDGGGIGTGTDVNTMAIYGKTPLTGYDHRFGLIGNDEPFNFISKVDGSDQIWTAKDVGAGGPRSTLFVDGESKGAVIGWRSGYMKVRYVSNPSTYVQRFEIEHEFILLPYYNEGDADDIIAGIQPDLLSGDATLKYALQMRFLNVLSNPNTAKTFLDDQTLGSVGGFGENFNGFNNLFSIASVDYLEISSGLSADGIIVGSPTRVTAVINSVDGVFTAGSIFGVYHSFLPTEADYTNQLSDYEEVWMYDNKIQTVGAGSVDGSIIKNLIGTFLGVSQIQIQFDIELSPTQQSRLEEGDQYILGFQVADNTLDSDNTDKVILPILAEYVKSSDIPGLVNISKINIYDHPHASETGPVAPSTTDFKGWPEDGINLSFNIERDLNEDATIDRVAVSLAAYDQTTGNSFLLDEYQIPLGTTVFTPDTPNDVQQLNVDTNRGFKLQSDDFFNLVYLKNAGRLIDTQMYLCRVGMKIRWEEWISQDGADTVFFDSSLPNNGLNKKASQYSLKEGYEIRAFVDIDMIQDGITTTYRFSSPAFDIRDYNLDQYVTPQWSSVIQTFAPNGTEITPNILTGDYTTFRTTHTWVSGPVVDISDFYAIHRIEESNAQGQVIEELSSITDRRPISNSKLVGIAGETRTKITLSGGGEVITECRIDPGQIASSTQYKLSCRLGSLTGTPLPVLGQKLAEDDTPKQKEDNDIKLLE